jgi:DNA primase
MIQGTKKNSLTIATILQRISEYDIFMYYMPYKNWKINVVTISPFRDEENPSFIIGNRNGNLSYIDFGDTDKRGDCFTFIKQLYGISSMDEVLKMIDRDFGLGISSKENIGEYKKIVSEYKQPEEAGKRYALVQAKVRKFTNEELAYWNTYYQDKTDLNREHVYSIEKVYLNKKLFTLSNLELRFGYFYDGYWKIYRPFASKKSKWVPNNVPITTMDGKENIVNCEKAFINKSKKDYMLIQKILPCTCAVQNEGVACFSHENIEYLKANSDKQILSFDSDVTGVKNSQQITKMFDFDYCNVPKIYLKEGIKDWADLARIHGLKTVEDYLKLKNVI